MGVHLYRTSSISQDVLKSDNLLHKRGFVDSLLQTTVRVIWLTDLTEIAIQFRIPHAHTKALNAAKVTITIECRDKMSSRQINKDMNIQNRIKP